MVVTSYVIRLPVSYIANSYGFCGPLCHELNQSRYESRIKMGDDLYNWQF
jgi:hypothetical protein